MHYSFMQIADMQEIASRLRWARKQAGYETATDAAHAFGWAVPTYSAHENGSRGLRVDKARRYAQAFRVSLLWLLTGEGTPGSPTTTPIVGHVGAGAEVTPVDDHQLGAGLEDSETPPDHDPELVAVRVVGQSMYPFYRDGDLVYYGAHTPSEDGFLGHECVVKLPDGRVFLKQVERGSAPGLYNLVSYNAPPIADQRLEWASPVRWILRA